MEGIKIIFLIALCLLPLCLLPLGAKGDKTKTQPPATQSTVQAEPVTPPLPETDRTDIPPAPQPPMEDNNPPPAVPPPEQSEVFNETEKDTLSPHFKLSEFRCPCGTCSGFTAYPDPQLIAVLETVRNRCDRSVVITSGVRCPVENNAAGGVSNSYHLYGKAADIYCPELSTEELLANICVPGVTVIPYYSQGFIHIQVP